jgi:DNA adenine methylase
VQPARPAAGYIGGKKQLAADIIELIERIPHET